MDSFTKMIDRRDVRFVYDREAEHWVVTLIHDYREYTGATHLKVLPEVEEKFVDFYFDNCEVKLDQVRSQQETIWMLTMPFMLQKKVDVVKLSKIPLGSNEELYIENRKLRDQVDALTERIRRIEIAVRGGYRGGSTLYQHMGFIKLINNKLHAIGFDEDFKKHWVNYLKTYKYCEEIGIQCHHDELDDCMEFMRTYRLKNEHGGVLYPSYWYPCDINGFKCTYKELVTPKDKKSPFGVNNISRGAFADINDITVAYVSYSKIHTTGKIYKAESQALADMHKMHHEYIVTAYVKPHAEGEWIIEYY
jgi:hypothetical protein